MQLRHIFLVDDDLDDQELFLLALEKIDSTLECKVANNGDEALNKLLQKQVFPSLIFLDLNMPLMNGQEFLKKIKQQEQFKNIPVFIFTTSSNPNTRKEVKQIGARDMITKPNSFKELVDLLKPIIKNITPLD